MSTEQNRVSSKALEEFLSSFESLTKDFTKQAISFAEDEDEVNVINAFAPALQSQVSGLCNVVRERATRASKKKIGEVDEVLTVTSGTALTKDARKIFPSLSSVVGKLGFSQIFQEVKKIIKVLLDVLGINLPGWLDDIINIIDEIVNTLLGGGSQKIANMLSAREQNYLAELTQLAHLQKASQFKYSREEDEDY